MTRRWVATTPVLAMLAVVGRPAAAPIMAGSGAPTAAPFGQAEAPGPSMPESGTPPPPQVVVGPLPGDAGPTTASDNARSQSPSATYTYQPPPVARPGTVTPDRGRASQRNPGNISNLRGTIGSASEGIFASPINEVTVDEAPRVTYNYLFAPTQAVLTNVTMDDAATVIPRLRVVDHPGHSVFVGLPIPSADIEPAAESRQITVISATGSVAPTVLVVAEPGAGDKAGKPWPTIGFATGGIQPTALRPGDAASTTLGYTYRPLRPRSATRLDPEAGEGSGATLATTMTAPNGGLATREATAPAEGDRPGSNAVTGGSAGVGYVPRRAVIAEPGVFVIARHAGGSNRVEQIAVPITIPPPPMVARAHDDMLFAADAAEMDESRGFLSYVLAAAAVVVPLLLAVFGFRMVRRTALRRLG